MSALELAAEIAADLRNRERRFALGYTDHDLTRPQIASYYRRQAAKWRRRADEGRLRTLRAESARMRPPREGVREVMAAKEQHRTDREERDEMTNSIMSRARTADEGATDPTCIGFFGEPADPRKHQKQAEALEMRIVLAIQANNLPASIETHLRNLRNAVWDGIYPDALDAAEDACRRYGANDALMNAIADLRSTLRRQNEYDAARGEDRTQL